MSIDFAATTSSKRRGSGTLERHYACTRHYALRAIEKVAAQVGGGGTHIWNVCKVSGIPGNALACKQSEIAAPVSQRVSGSRSHVCSRLRLRILRSIGDYIHVCTYVWLAYQTAHLSRIALVTLQLPLVRSYTVARSRELLIEALRRTITKRWTRYRFISNAPYSRKKTRDFLTIDFLYNSLDIREVWGTRLKFDFFDMIIICN